MVDDLVYKSLLIRIWQEAGRGADTGKTVWHFEVKSIQTGESSTFSKLAPFLKFIGEQAENDTPGEQE